jgi:4-hydroxybenzoate polyprenyltransferase
MVKRANIVPTIHALVVSSRPNQWIKNSSVLIPLIFSLNESWDLGIDGNLFGMLLGMLNSLSAFIFISSAIYLLNDCIDIDRDKLHVFKKNRPIAKGTLQIPVARFFSGLFVLSAIILGTMINWNFVMILLVYFGLMIAYSLFLKSFVLADIVCISFGFLLRVLGGAVAIDVPVSWWLYSCILFGSIFIALCKRYSEKISSGTTQANTRSSLFRYNIFVLRFSIIVDGLVLISIYIFYTLMATNLPINNTMLITIPFVITGVMRYMYLVILKGIGERPENIIMTDKVIVPTVICWIMTVLLVLTLFR